MGRRGAVTLESCHLPKAIQPEGQILTPGLLMALLPFRELFWAVMGSTGGRIPCRAGAKVIPKEGLMEGTAPLGLLALPAPGQ